MPQVWNFSWFKENRVRMGGLLPNFKKNGLKTLKPDMPVDSYQI